MRTVVTKALLIAATLSLAACVHSALPRMESARVASEVGFPKCRVSVPLTEEEVLVTARLTGISAPETQADWPEMKAAYRAGDQLRFVSCVSGKGIGSPGYSFFGLFRGSRVAARALEVVDN
jgi:hypothetical protein